MIKPTVELLKEAKEDLFEIIDYAPIPKIPPPRASTAKRAGGKRLP